jgi:hypothetical protein
MATITHELALAQRFPLSVNRYGLIGRLYAEQIRASWVRNDVGELTANIQGGQADPAIINALRAALDADRTGVNAGLELWLYEAGVAQAVWQGPVVGIDLRADGTIQLVGHDIGRYLDGHLLLDDISYMGTDPSVIIRQQALAWVTGDSRRDMAINFGVATSTGTTIDLDVGRDELQTVGELLGRLAGSGAWDWWIDVPGGRILRFAATRGIDRRADPIRPGEIVSYNLSGSALPSDLAAFLRAGGERTDADESKWIFDVLRPQLADAYGYTGVSIPLTGVQDPVETGRAAADLLKVYGQPGITGTVTYRLTADRGMPVPGDRMAAVALTSIGDIDVEGRVDTVTLEVRGDGDPTITVDLVRQEV